MIAELPFCLFGAGFGSFTAGGTRERALGWRSLGVGLMGAALALVAQPARADQFRQAADNAEVACRISSRELTRISLVGDAFANVSKITSGVPGQDFTVTSEPVRGDIYLSVPDGWTAASLSFFATSRKGFVYKFACSVEDIPAEQLFVTNPALASASAEQAAPRSPRSEAIELVTAMASDAVPKTFVVRQPASQATRVGALQVSVIAEYEGSGLVGRHLRIDNKGRETAALDMATLTPAHAVAVSVGAEQLAPGSATNLYVVLPAGDDR
jgi:conjugal transfer pilus assembly protein TraK